jgi:hypothetical protein
MWKARPPAIAWSVASVGIRDVQVNGMFNALFESFRPAWLTTGRE